MRFAALVICVVLSGTAMGEDNRTLSGAAMAQGNLALSSAPIAQDNLALSSAPIAQDNLAAEIDSFCQRVDRKLSSVNRRECVRIGLLDSGADSFKATPLFYKDFGSEDESATRVLLVGGIHGDEYSSVSIVFKWLAMLEEDLGERFHWRVVPVLNPDGLLRPPRMSQRMNANGVDLNRNFPTPDWEAKAFKYWVNRARKNKRRYPGPAPLSEPETAWLVQQIETFQPHAVVSVHAPHGVVDFDGPRVPPEQLGPLELRLLGTYPGSMGRYIGIHKGIPLLTLELESAFGMPAQNEVYAIWYDMLGWLHEKIALPLKLAEETEHRVPAMDIMRMRSDPDNEG
ncbi:MAG: M14 family zinc carboxypeptidase [Gammaproteobacteria bacterium]|nr:M14 family zinc carboxypeptidase [Gammaproteobacteria bacterium]